MLLFPGPIVSIFAAGDTALIEAAAPAVRIVMALCALGYTGQMMSSYFECVEKIGEAIVCGIALYIIFTIPLVFVLGAAVGVSGVCGGRSSWLMWAPVCSPSSLRCARSSACTR